MCDAPSNFLNAADGLITIKLVILKGNIFLQLIITLWAIDLSELKRYCRANQKYFRGPREIFSYHLRHLISFEDQVSKYFNLYYDDLTYVTEVAVSACFAYSF